MQAQQEASVQSPAFQSMLYQTGGRSRRVSSASHGSPAGSSGTYRASSQLLPLDLHPSDPLSLYDSPQQNPANPSPSPPDPALAAPHQASLTQSRLMRVSAEAPNSTDSVSVDESGSPGTHVAQPGSQQQGGVGVTAGVGGQPSLDRAAMSVLQVRFLIWLSVALRASATDFCADHAFSDYFCTKCSCNNHCCSTPTSTAPSPLLL